MAMVSLGDSINKMEVEEIAQDASLTSEYQRYLVYAGILDPIYRINTDNSGVTIRPSDGILGPETEAAIYIHRVKFDGRMDLPGVDHFDCADRRALDIVEHMIDLGYHLSTVGPNIVYCEGLNEDFTRNDNTIDGWNDLRILLSIRENKWTVTDVWRATTAPGLHYTKRPMNRLGTARVVPGQYKAWRMGLHKGSQPALQQAGPILISRDVNRDGTGDMLMVANATINQHSTSPNAKPPEKVGKWSAGCLVGQDYSAHLRFLSAIRNDPRYTLNVGYKFITTIIT